MAKPRNTIAKTEILNLIEQSDKALSHSEIQQHLSGLCDRVTIYRVLDRLYEEGLIHKTSTIDGVVKYAACIKCTPEKHYHSHLHFNCESCHKVICLVDVKPIFKLSEDYTVREMNFMLSGICPECA